jgi:hypothetical protein
MQSRDRGVRLWHLLALGAIPVLFALFGSAAAHEGPALTPEAVVESIADGQSVQITKTVHTPAVPPNPEICFLADTTGSMVGALANVQANIGAIMNTIVNEAAGTPRFCAAQYRDVGDTPVFSLDQTLTADTTAVSTAVGAWVADGGGDVPEDQLHALTILAGASPGWTASPPATHVIVWFGDSSGHDPASAGETLASTIAALTTTGAGAPIIVIAIDVVSGFGDGLDATGQATAITNATGGMFLTAATPGQVSDAILAGLTSLPVTVSMVSNCSVATGGVVSVSFAPASQIVSSGQHAVFTETMSVTASPAEQGQTYECDDWALIDGEPMTDRDGNRINEHKTITVPDTTPPAVRCAETVNPSGRNVPASGLGAGNSGQNPDGFYELLATDNVDPNPEIFVVDKGKDGVLGTADDTTFGPFESGTKIKYVEANGATPSQKPGAGDVDWIIQGNGDFAIIAVDASGNVSRPLQCHVPPPPKR